VPCRKVRFAISPATGKAVPVETGILCLYDDCSKACVGACTQVVQAPILCAFSHGGIPRGPAAVQSVPRADGAPPHYLSSCFSVRQPKTAPAH
jgi:hypothetical protein